MPDDRNAAKAKDAPKEAGKDAAKGAPAADAAKKPAKAKNPKRKLIMIGAAAAVLIIGIAIAFFVLRPAPAAPDSADATAPAKPGEKAKGAAADKGKDGKKAEKGKPVFVDLDMITVNLKDPEKFLQIKLTFQLHSADAVEPLKEMMPILRNAVIPVLGAQEPAELMTTEGKEKLSTQVVEAANKALASTEIPDAIDSVLITHMIIQ
jgi:flagellar protein FliL